MEHEQPEERQLQVLIADDHQIFRDGLKALISRSKELKLVGEATTGEEAVAKAEHLQPDVVLMDIQMPGMGGIEATRRILEVSPHIKVLMVTMYDDDTWVFEAMRAGARGYLLKGATHREVLRAIQAVGSGEAIFSPGIASRMISFFGEKRVRDSAPPQPFPDLTDRERQILGLIAQGCSNAEIAERYDLALKTVRNHVSNVLTKLQVADRAHAIVLAREAGLK